MNRSVTLFTFLAMFVTSLAGQNGDWVQSTTPKILSITTEFIKVGQQSAHEKTESGWPRAFKRANYPSYFIGLSSTTGSPSMLFLTAYDSFEAAQKDNDSQDSNQWLSVEQEKLRIEDSAYLSGTTHEYGELLPELSVPAKFPLGAARCFSVTRFEVDPSQQKEFRDWLRGQIAARSSVLSYLATYRTIVGGSVSTFVLIQARASLAAFDRDRFEWDSVSPAVKSITQNIFQPEPTMSRVTPEFAKGNEKFWLPSER